MYSGAHCSGTKGQLAHWPLGDDAVSLKELITDMLIISFYIALRCMAQDLTDEN